MAAGIHFTKGCVDLIDFSTLCPETPVLIAGPTGAGKSALAMAIAQRQGGVIVNADALQIYDGWRVLTARPSATDEATVPHALYGYVGFEASYSVGEWLRALRDVMAGGLRPIIVGGTGLYFRGLTEGLAEIPPIPPDIRAQADGHDLDRLASDLVADTPDIATRIDMQNPARLRRAWEVLAHTGRSIIAWQDETPAPLLPLHQTQPFVFDADRDWLNARIARRFHQMIAQGALDEARQNLPRWARAGGAAKAIGAPELMAHLQGDMTLQAACDAAIVASRQYAKRQRTWFRARMSDWVPVSVP